MRFQDIEIGKEYGVRLKVSTSQPLLRVLVLDKVLRNKQVKLRHVEGDSTGMEEFLPFRHFIVEWSGRKSFLREEQERLAVEARSARTWERVTADAMNVVWGATGEGSIWLHGHLSGPRAELERVLQRAGMQTSITDLGGFVDRMGQAQIPFDSAEKIAMAFAAAEPDSVTMTVAADEEELRARGYGDSIWHNELRKRRPAFALVRQWAGVEAESVRLRSEVNRLRNILGMAIADLRAAERHREARQLERLMDGK